MTTAENCYDLFGEIVYGNEWEAEISVISHADWYIGFLILSIYLALKPFWANISIFWFYRYILLKNLFEQIYRFFDFINISCSKTFSSKYIFFLILSIYLARKLFWANILIFDFTDISRLETFLSEYIGYLILLIYLARKPFRASISIFWFYSYILLGNLSSEYIYFPGWAINKNIKKKFKIKIPVDVAGDRSRWLLIQILKKNQFYLKSNIAIFSFFLNFLKHPIQGLSQDQSYILL